MHPWIMNPWIPFHEWAGETPSDWCPIVLFTFKASRIHIKPFVAILSKEIQFALWFKATLSKIFVATIQALWVVSSLEFILHLLPQSLQRKSWLLSDSMLLFKNLYGNNSSLVSSSSLEFILNLLPQSLQRKSCLLSDSKLHLAWEIRVTS